LDRSTFIKENTNNNNIDNDNTIKDFISPGNLIINCKSALRPY